MSNGLHKDPESLLRDAAEHFSAVPGEDVWTGIEEAIKQKGKRRRFAWLFILPVLLIPAVIFIAKPFKATQQTAATVKENNPPTGSHTQPITTPAAGNNNASPAPAQEAAKQQPAAGTNDAAAYTGSNKNNTAVTPPVTGKQQSRSFEKNDAATNNTQRTTANHNRFTAGASNKANRSEKPSRRAKRNAAPGTEIVPAEENIAGNTKTAPAEETPAIAETTETKQEPVVVEKEPVTVKEEPVIMDVAKTIPQEIKTEQKKEEPKLTPKQLSNEIVRISLPRRNKFRYGFSVSAGAGYRMLQAYGSAKSYGAASALNGGSRASASGINNLQHQPTLVAGAGALASLSLSRKWSIEAGIEYQILGYNVRAYKTSPVQLNYTSSGAYVTTVAADLNSRYVSSPAYATNGVEGNKILRNRYQFINIPVTAMYEMNAQGKKSFYIKGGLGVSYLVDHNAYIYSPERGRYFLSPTPEVYRNLNVSGILQPGYLFRLKDNHEVRVGLDLQFNLLPTHNRDITLREYLYGAGIKIGYLLR